MRAAVNSSQWCKAATLSERWAGLAEAGPAAAVTRDAEDAQSERRFREWQSQPPFDKAPLFAERLAQQGLDPGNLRSLLAETPESLRRRCPHEPVWVRRLEEILLLHGPAQPENSCESPEGGAGFATAVLPWVRWGRDRLEQGIRRLARWRRTPPMDPTIIPAVLLDHLTARLVSFAGRTLVLELHVARLRGQLRGSTSEERFQHFSEILSRRENLLPILEEYPVLARLLVTAAEHWLRFSLEFLEHLSGDQDRLRTTFFGGEDPGILTGVEAGAGDVHCRGKSVLILEFANGGKLVYKPRSMAVETHFQELLLWVNGCSAIPPFRTLKTLDCGDHGWVEYLAAEPCPDLDAVHRFYLRQGGYLALLYLLEATDLHSENLLAVGEHPVLIDTETLFHPRPRTSGDPWSVLGVGLLPSRIWGSRESEGIDLSGLGYTAGQVTPFALPAWESAGTDGMRVVRRTQAVPGQRNRPILRGREVVLADFAADIERGFSSVYRALMDRRGELASAGGVLGQFGADEVRFIPRATQVYAAILDSSFHPDVLRDALDRDRYLDILWIQAGQEPHLKRLIPSEVEDLWQADIPRFSSCPNSRDLWNSSGARLADFFECASLENVRARLWRLSEQDRSAQLDLIRAALSGCGPGKGGPPSSESGTPAG